MRAVRRMPRTKTKKGNKKEEKKKAKEEKRRGKHDTTPSHQPSEKKKRQDTDTKDTHDGHHTTAKTTPQNSITSRGGTGFPCKKPGFGMISMPGRRDTPLMRDAYPIRKGRWKEGRA